MPERCPSAILRCHPDTCRNYKKKAMTATHTTQHSEPCTRNTTSHKVRAALASPSHPLEESVCPLGKAEILVLWEMKSVMESQALRLVLGQDNHLCTRRAWAASETFSSCSAVLWQKAQQHNNVEITQHTGIRFKD